MITRSFGEQQEIWLTGHTYGKTSNQASKTIILIYKPELREWEFISTDIGDTSLVVGWYLAELFVARDGTVWGRTEWDSLRGHPTLEHVPVLSRFNESTRSFELAQGALEIPLVMGQQYFSWPELVLDHEGIFWIFADNNGLYRYDPTAESTEKVADLPSFEFADAALSPDGSIYFEKSRWAGDTNFRLAAGTLFQFFPETREVISVDVPDEEWPVYAGLLVDHTGRLWLGSVGYREPNGNWRLLHSNTSLFFDHIGHYLYASPYPVLESSDGLLWFTKYLDTGGWGEGTAWYNPNTAEGCMFTNQPAIIVEDSEQQLWLAADGILYRYPLNP